MAISKTLLNTVLCYAHYAIDFDENTFYFNFTSAFTAS